MFPFVILQIELYTSKQVNPIIRLESKPRLIDGSNEEIFLGCVSLNSNVS